MPDILLLAPIARLLEISVDELLSFREELTEADIADLVRELDQKCLTEEFQNGYAWARNKIEEYPNCYPLMVHLAASLDANRLIREVIIPDGFEAYIESQYRRALDSKDEAVRRQALDALFAYYVRHCRYDEAESYVKLYSDRDPEKKRRQAQIYLETGRQADAYRLYEELLLADYQRASASLHGIYLLAMEEKDYPKARRIADKQAELARVFEMGRYYEVSPHLELAVLEQDTARAEAIMEEMLRHTEDIAGFRKSLLYSHMTFKEIDPSFAKQLRDNLKQSFSELVKTPQ